MSKGFVHSIKVPRLYKSSAKIVREVRENGGSLKSLIYEHKHANVPALYSLCVNTLQKEAQLDQLIKEINLSVNEPRLDLWLAKILITELLWGKKTLNNDSKPVQVICSYEKQLKEALNNISDVETIGTLNKKVRKARYVRINTLLLPLEEGISYFKEEGWSLIPKCLGYTNYLNAVKNLKWPSFIQDYHIPELLVFPGDSTFYNHPLYQSGEIILQDKASCLPPQLLNPEPGSVVLDMCAAPGMKTTHLAALMKNTGKIYAIEVHERRYMTLCEQIKVTNATCVKAINKDVLTLEANDFSDVQYILVDATCSGSGMLDRQIVYGKEKYNPKRLKQLRDFQVILLRHALLNFPNTKQVVYSTCSINPEENEQVIDEILEDVHDAYKLVPVKKLLKGDWLNFSSKDYKCSDKCLYANSDVDMCNGFFVAVFQRNFDVPLPKYKRKTNLLANNVTFINEQPDENDGTEVAGATVSAIRKRKKRGKRKNANQRASESHETEESALTSVPGNIKIRKKINNDKDSLINEVESSSQYNDEVQVVNDGDKLIVKKKKKKSKSGGYFLKDNDYSSTMGS